MKSNFEILSVDKAIKKLARIKKIIRKSQFVLLISIMIRLKKVVASYSESCNIIKNGMTITHNQDEYISHLEVFSVVQDINNILPKGTMHDILIGSE